MKDYAELFMNRSRAATLTADFLQLSEWDIDPWRKLLAVSTPRPVKASEVVIQRGVVDRSLYFVAEGTFEVGITYVDGVSITPLAKIGAGSVLGEQSFFDGEPRSANAWAVSSGELLCLSVEKFQQLAQREPVMTRDFLFALGRILSLRLRHTTMRVRR